MKNSLSTLLIIPILLYSCCPIVSVNPLSPSSGLDTRIKGLWKLQSNDGDIVYMHIGIKSENTMEALSVEHKSNGSIEKMTIPFFITKTINNSYLNVKIEDLGREISQGEEGFIFLRYGLKDENTLYIYHLDPKPITSAVQANKLKGTITHKGVSEGEKNNAGSSVKSIGCVTITDSSANIVGFIEAKKAEELYSDVMKFERVK